jgi:site-specific DNA-methyltransferase (adenine-specific)
MGHGSLFGGESVSHKRSSKIVTPKDEWQTPQWLFDLLNKEFEFDCDVAATRENTKCCLFMVDALSLPDWCGYDDHFETDDGDGDIPVNKFFLNPPYSAALINAFMKKAYEESSKGAIVVCLVPVSGDKWWIDYALKAQEIRYIRGRVKFVGYDEDGNQVNGSPMFSSCVVIFRPTNARYFVGGPEAFMPTIGKTIEQPKKGSMDEKKQRKR